MTAASDGGHAEATNRQRELKMMQRLTILNLVQWTGDWQQLCCSRIISTN